MNAPGLVPGGRETDALTDFSDLLPTFAELGQAQLPKGVTLDGKSFAPLLLGQADDSPRDWIMAIGHGAGRLDKDGVRGTRDFADRVFRDKRYKVWLGNKPEITALYDLKNDPLGLHNLLKSTKAGTLGCAEEIPRHHRQPAQDRRAPVVSTAQGEPVGQERQRPAGQGEKAPAQADRRRQRNAAQQ